MEFDSFEYEFSTDGAGQARRIGSMLVEQGYNSLQRDALDLLRKYLPNSADGQPDDPVTAARTVDVLVPAAHRTARILICERPSADGGITVAVVALGRSHDEANRSRTAAQLALNAFAAPAAGESGRRERFREEWARALGLVPADGHEPAASSMPRPLASSRALFALQSAPAVLGRPALLRSRMEKSTNGARGLDPAPLDGLSSEGLIDRSFVLMCRQTGQIVGVGKDAAEVQAAMQLTLRCPHCRRPLNEEVQDVLYSLSPQGEEFMKSTRWMRDALESSLRRRHCDPVVLSGAANARVDGAACYKDVVLVFRLRDGAPSEDDVQAMRQAVLEFAKVAPGVPVRGVVVATDTASSAVAGGRTSCAFLNASQLEDSMDRLFEELKRDAFVRLTGTSLAFLRPDLGALLARPA